MIYQLLISCRKFCIPQDHLNISNKTDHSDVILNILNSDEYSMNKFDENSPRILDVFPQYFNSIFSFLSKYHILKNWKEKAAHSLSYLPLISNFPSPGFDIVLPFFINFFKCKDTMTESLSFVDLLMSRLGLQKSTDLLLGPLLSLFEVGI